MEKEKVYCSSCRYFIDRKFYLDCDCRHMNNKKDTWKKIDMEYPCDINENNDCEWYIQK